MAAKKNKIDVSSHFLVPKHVLLNEKQKKELFEKYSITVVELPKINMKDPAIIDLKAKEGDVVKILRISPTAGESTYYRCVIDG